MKPAAQNQLERLESRSELPSLPQLPLRLGAPKPTLRLAPPCRLRAGDFVLFNERICPVLHVNDCAAVIAVAQRAREFTTIFGKCVSLRPKPRLVRISPNSEIPILNRRKRCPLFPSQPVRHAATGGPPLFSRSRSSPLHDSLFATLPLRKRLCHGALGDRAVEEQDDFPAKHVLSALPGGDSKLLA